MEIYKTSPKPTLWRKGLKFHPIGELEVWSNRLAWIPAEDLISQRYRDWLPDQSWLFPPSPGDWLPEGYLVYFVKDVVRELDLSDFTANYEATGQG